MRNRASAVRWGRHRPILKRGGAALAFLLHRAIEKKLKAARLDLSACLGADTFLAQHPQSARLFSCVGPERGSVPPGKVFSGEPCPFHNTRSRIPSRSLALSDPADLTGARVRQRSR